MITLWPEKTAVSLQLLHVGYGLGALLVPLLVNPYLAVIEVPKLKPEGQTEVFTVITESRVQDAFVIIGIGTIVLALVFYRYHFIQPSSEGYKQVTTDINDTRTKNVTFKEMINPATYANGQFKYGLFIISILFLYFFNMVGCEEVFGHFVRSFCVEVFNFSKTKASYLNMTFWLGLTVGRLVGSVLSNYIAVRRLFMIQVLLHTFSTTMLNIYASASPTMLWYCTFTEGFLVSPLFPGGIAYGNTMIELTGVCLMIITLASSSGDLCFIWIAGNLYDSFGPKSVLYGMQFVGFAVLVCAILLRIGERYKKETEIVVKT